MKINEALSKTELGKAIEAAIDDRNACVIPSSLFWEALEFDALATCNAAILGCLSYSKHWVEDGDLGTADCRFLVSIAGFELLCLERPKSRWEWMEYCVVCKGESRARSLLTIQDIDRDEARSVVSEMVEAKLKAYKLEGELRSAQETPVKGKKTKKARIESTATPAQIQAAHDRANQILVDDGDEPWMMAGYEVLNRRGSKK